MFKSSALILTFVFASLVLTVQARAANTLLADQFQLVFGPQGSGSTSLPQTVNFTNTGAAPITNFAFTISGPNAGDFSFQSGCTTLTSAASCPVQVSFKPSAGGVRTATLSVMSSGAPSPLTVALQGITANSNDTYFDFNVDSFVPLTAVGTTTNFDVTVGYHGPGSVTVVSAQVTGPDASEYQATISDPTCPQNSCPLSVAFTPTGVRVRTATLVVITSAGAVDVPLNQVAANASASASLSPTALTFTTEGVNVQSPPQQVTFKVSGTNVITVNSVVLSGPDAADFSLDDHCSGSQLGELDSSCNVVVIFTPQAPGPRSAILTFRSTDPSGPHSATLSGTGVTSGASLVVGNLTETSYFYSQFGPVYTYGVITATGFAPVTIGSLSTNTNSILNTAATPVSVTETISGENAGDFVLNPNHNPSDCVASPSLAPNASCSSTIGFMPTAAGTRTAVLTVANSGSGISQTFDLAGTGLTGTKIIVFQTTAGTPASQRGFGSAPVGTTVQGYLQVKNAGTEPVTLSGSYFSGGNYPDFAIASYQCTSSQTVLQPGDTCLATVNFTPSGEGYRIATLNIFDDAQNGTQTIAVSGAGEPAALPPSVSPEAVDFSYTQVGITAYSGNIKFTNYGTGQVTLTGFSIAGANASDFAVYQNGCPAVIGPNASCTASVQFTPSVMGAEVAYLMLKNNSSAGSAVVALYGFGQAGTNTGVYATPAAVHFAPPSTSGYETLNIQLTNPGGAPLQILSTSVTGPDASEFQTNFSVVDSIDACGVNIQFNTCTLSVQFVSNSSAPQVATLTVITTAGTATIPLVGNSPTFLVGLRYQDPITISANVGSTVEYDERVYQTGTEAATINVGLGILNNDFALGAVTCDATGYNCIVPILFTPSQSGPDKSSLTLIESPGVTVSIPINGVGH